MIVIYLTVTDHIQFSLDGQLYGTVSTGDGFYKRGGFTDPNPWANGAANAPFDQEFNFIVNTAIGGTNGFFPDSGNANGKPWKNNAQYAKRDFFNGIDQWLKTWSFDPSLSNTSALQIAYIKVTAL